jgi:hypothetical protein
MPKQWIARAALAILLFVVAASSTRIALAEDVLVAEYSGKGVQTTRPFTVDGPWEVQWSSDCLNLAIYLKKSDEAGHASADLIANQSKGSGSSYQPRGGSYFLEIHGVVGTWRVKVVAIK